MTQHETSVASALLLDLVREIAVRAAEFALDARRAGVSVAATKSTATDIVTAVDRDTETLIRSLILEARPHDGIVGEEEATHTGTSGLDWIVDPIDGTVNFLYGIPAWAVSIAVAEGAAADGTGGRTLAGVVVNPVNGELFEASVDGGARLAGRELAVNTDVPLGEALVGTGFGYASERRREQAEVLLRLLPQFRDIRRLGSAALDLCALAAGRLDAYYERGLNVWDHAAGALIAREAGARIGGIGGGVESQELIVAAAPGLYEELADALRSAGLDA
ncbi:inositol monophosphatase family protein [Agromyces sp. Marseille-P2726]|uniref:inositol monophosphatase family protein n=1 Tax=Agromyces sp. Marseille-P2726 TaxID=2709132 RepID=UPI00156EB805|nr:inositol monophosphatase family protein [Agromyces sp. Marseille-P2726]